MATYKGTNSATFAMDKFVPALWSPRILKNLHDKQILATKTTREYEGEIKGKGDTVKIHGVGSITVADYVVNSTEITYENGSDTEILVEVDTAKYFAFAVEDIEAAQADPKFMSVLSAEAAVAMAKTTDNYLYNKMHDAAIAAAVSGGLPAGGSHSSNVGVLTLDTTAAGKMYESLVDLGVALDDLLCPDDGRYVVLPSFCKGLLLKDDRFVAYGSDGQANARDNGKFGRIAGFEVITMPRSTFTRWDAVEANAVTDGDADTKNTYRCLAGRQGAYAYVEQLTKTENIRLEKAFKDGVRGLHVFGGGAIRPQFMLVADAENPSVG